MNGVRCWGAMLAAVAAATSVSAQLTPPPLSPPLHIGAANPVVDEFGVMLKGVGPAAAQFGHTAVLGEIVQILTATNGVYPPDAAGNPDPQNALIYEGRIGDGIDPGAGATGKFGFSVPKRTSGATVVARVFNRSSLPDASFYADSQTFYIDPSFNFAFIPAFGPTTQPVDTSDADGDGLIASWEKSLGGNPDDPDTDGDGMGDQHEWRAGTQITNSASLLAMVQLEHVGEPVMEVVWDSVAGKQYQVEHKAGDLLAATPYVPVSSTVTATGFSMRVSVTNERGEPIGNFRVRLVEP